LDELIDILKKFKDGECTLEDFYRRLSWIAVPNEYVDLIENTEKELEMIRFTRLEEKWYEEATIIIDNLLAALNLDVE